MTQCNSATTQIPVIYVFGNAPVDVDDCAQQLGAQLSRVSADKTAVLLYEPRFHHARNAILSALKQQHSERRLVLGEMDTFFDPKQRQEAGGEGEKDVPEGYVVHRVGGQRVVLPSDVGLTSEAAALLYVGAESAHLTSILMRFSSLDCFSYDPDMLSVRKEGAVVNKALMRRYVAALGRSRPGDLTLTLSGCWWQVLPGAAGQGGADLRHSHGHARRVQVPGRRPQPAEAHQGVRSTISRVIYTAFASLTRSLRSTGAGASRTCSSWAR